MKITNIKKINVVCECKTEDGQIEEKEIAFEGVDDCVVESVDGTKNKLTCYFKSILSNLLPETNET